MLLRRLPQAIGKALLVLYFVIGSLILLGRLALPPWLGHEREFVAHRLSSALGAPVSIGEIVADWPGLNPRLVLRDVEIRDHTGRKALELARIEGELSVRSLWTIEPVFSHLVIEEPFLEIHRDGEGRLFVAGLPVEGSGKPGLLRWALKQKRIEVRGARIEWRDEWRKAPTLRLAPVDFEFRNVFFRHAFGLRAQASETAAQRFEARGEWRGDLKDFPRIQGRIFLELLDADLSVWRHWLDLPSGLMGARGSARLWGERRQDDYRFVADLALADVRLALDQTLPALEGLGLTGRIRVGRVGERYFGKLEKISWRGTDELVFEDFTGELEWTPHGDEAGGRLAFDRLDLAALVQLMRHLPLPAAAQETLARFSPAGRCERFEAAWEGALTAVRRWRVKGVFDKLAFAPWREFPGASGLTGSIEGNETSGVVRLSSRHLKLILPAVFPEKEVALTDLEGEGGWTRKGDALEFRLDHARFANPEAKGEAHGQYRFTGVGLGEIDLSARLARATGQAVWRYLPFVVSLEAREWLKRALVGGEAQDVTLRLKGPLDRFPYRDGKSGVFQVKGRILGAKLDYAPLWPMISRIDGELLFEGPRMLIRAQRAELAGVALSDVRAEIPDLEAPQEVLQVSGQARGKTQAFLDFVEKSPIGARIDYFTRDFSAQGEAVLDLKFTMPLREVAKTKVDGRLRIADNVLKVAPEAPALTQVSGELRFSEESIAGKGLRAQLAGMPLIVDLASRAQGRVQFGFEGRLAATGLRALDVPLSEHLSGETVFRGQILAGARGLDWSLTSDLVGLASSLPEPFNKTTLTKKRLSASGRWQAEKAESTFELEEAAQAKLSREKGLLRGALALGRAAKLPTQPERGIAIAYAEAMLDLDFWRRALHRAKEEKAETLLPVVRLEVSAAQARLMNRDFHQLRLSARKSAGAWRLDLAAAEIQGQLVWEGEGERRLAGRLARLYVPSASEAGGVEEEEETSKPPALALNIDDFRFEGRALGAVDLSAESREGLWRMRFEAKNEAARLSGTGSWRPRGGQAQTRIEFKLDIEDGEKLLARLRLPDAVRGARGRIEGRLAWSGSPFAWQPERLEGELAVDLGRGQFKKLEPGVGRLLGILSLQSLPRRIVLDFRDVFSEGFAFDSLTGQTTIAAGQMRSENLEISGPAARVLLSGSVDLVHETQNLKVRIQPAIGDTLATGALLVNPAVGAATWLAQKILKDPLGQAFAFEYAITGSWTDPQVTKIVSPSSATP
ncbi:MAG: YhdP family protein [Rhodocyclaceae bacterium]|nr:YhdP family protein [Rhodocyclaceae bacterium]